MLRFALGDYLDKVQAPDCCGVYLFFDRRGEVIYVGKSINLRRRMQDYLSKSRKKKNRKQQSIAREVVRVEFDVCTDEQAALLLENRLIQTLKPKYNVAGAFSFLYPVIAARYENRRLNLVRTTLPQHYTDFLLFGAFRSRNLTGEMFGALEFVLSFIGHKEPPSRMRDIPTADYSKRLAFRRIDKDIWEQLQSYLTGHSDQLVDSLFKILINDSAALRQGADIESSLKTIRLFFRLESQKLWQAFSDLELAPRFLTQGERDALFIKVRQSPF